MSDREATLLLTKIGFLYLKKMGCHTISTEIHIPIRDHYLTGKDSHYAIDLLGISKKYIPYKQQKEHKKLVYGDKEVDGGVIKFHNVLRGIEVKVSRGDFNNGFIHGGCHYNYLLVPKGLIKPSEVHSDIGIIEVDFEQLAVIHPKYVTMQNQGFHLSGIQIGRKPKRKQIDGWVVDRCFSQIGETLTNQAKRWLVETFNSQLKKEENVPH